MIFSSSKEKSLFDDRWSYELVICFVLIEFTFEAASNKIERFGVFWTRLFMADEGCRIFVEEWTGFGERGSFIEGANIGSWWYIRRT